MTREILFYSDFRFGSHNPEAEEKMARFAARGYRVHYVEQLGIRNPRPRHLLRVAGRLRLRPRQGRAPFEVVSPKLLAPRRAPVIDRVNRAWLTRQLLAHVKAPAETILWIRYPTPELLELVERRDWRAVVYEVVDDHEHTPGMNERLRRLFRAAEARILERADLVFAWSEPIQRRLQALHPNVALASAAVDVEAFSSAARDTTPDERLAVYAGHLDFRFDAGLVADAARRLADWRFLLAGPAERSATGSLGDIDNVQLVGEVPASEVPPMLARAAVCLMPYRAGAFTDTLFPIKLVEYLAAGRPIVSTPLRAVERFGATVTVAGDGARFAQAIEQAARDDALAARAQRVELARPYSWDARIDQMQAAIEAAAHD